jgi:hypothetical protein
LFMFHKLIRRRRGTPDAVTDGLEVDGVALEGASMTNGWADYFDELSTPIENNQYDRNIRTTWT